jgi:hypothetical protein
MNHVDIVNGNLIEEEKNKPNLDSKNIKSEPESFEIPAELTKDQNTPFFTKVFQESHITLLIGFLAVYFIVYVAFGAYIRSVTGGASESNDELMSKIFDYMIFALFIIYCGILYFTSSEYTKNHLIEVMMEWSIDMFDDVVSVFAVALFIITFYLLVFLIQIPMSGKNKPFSVSLLEQKAWIFLACLLIHNFFKYVLGIDMVELIFRNPDFSKLWKTITSDKPMNVSGNVSGNVLLKNTLLGNVISGNVISGNVLSGNIIAKKPDEVFNISNNLYSYDDAQAICTSYGARLANYDEIEDAYNHGGEWCNYGWSEGQMILFPTQKSTWDKLQKNDKTKNNCGRPGVNGGYIHNPSVKFGVNCFGQKPVPTDADLKMMAAQQNQPVPKTKEDLMLDKKVQFWKEHADKLLKLNAFNKQKWSEY